VEGNNKISVAPDVLVAFERPKGYRGSYLQWKENNIPPQVVFEILSPRNTLTEMAKKWQFYNHYDVEEYYLYDPDKNDLSGWIRGQNDLEVIENVNNWISPRLKIKFILGTEELEIYRPNGEKFVDYIELETQKQLAQEQAKFAQEQAKLAQEQAKFAQEQAKFAQEQAKRLADKLRELGINPEEI
jgi:Uma2 family endonuclease